MTDDDKKDTRNPQDLAGRWLQDIDLSLRDHKDFFENGKNVISRYKSGQGSKASTQRKFNILFSNVEVIRSALYGKTAKPDVRRRNADRNPEARQAAVVLERALAYCSDLYDVDGPIKSALKDMLLPGRGTVRVEYEPVMTEAPVMTVDPMGQAVPTDQMQPVIADQKLILSYVYWEDFVCEAERCWSKVNWIAFRHNMGREDLRALHEQIPQSSKKYGKIEDIPLSWRPEGMDESKTPEHMKKAEVWEVWDKRKRERLWLVKGYSWPLRIDQDPLGLVDFWPIPAPPMFYGTTESIIPEPEFFAYKDQADDLDEITTRISRLTRALKRRGVYDKSVPELRKLATAQDNEFIAADNYAALAQKGGLQGAFQSEDVSSIAKVLIELYKQRDQLIQSIYEVTGISDIVRGATKANETATAQQLKSQFGSLRLKERQQLVQNWIRDLYRIKGELIAEHFEPHVLQKMTGIEVTPQMMQLLRDDKLRGYNVNIETDSTVFEDAAQEKRDRIEVVTAMGQYLTQALPIGQAMPPLVPVMFDILGFMVRGFKAGRELEDKLEQAQQQVMDMIQQQAQQPPKPDPEIEMAKMEMEQARETHQMDMQGKQLDAQVHQVKAQADLQKMAMQSQAQMQKAMMQPQPGAMNGP